MIMLSRSMLSVRNRTAFAARHLKCCDCTAENVTYIKYKNILRLREAPQTITFVRLASTTNIVPLQITKVVEASGVSTNVGSNVPSVDSVVSSIGPIPDTPVPPVPEPPVIEILSNGEPSLASLGLDSWWPSGLIQKALELTHVGLDVPWWASIVIVTAVMRIVLFPLVVKQLRTSSELAKSMPAITYLQEKMNEARARNDMIAAGRIAAELTEYMRDNKTVTPFSVLKYSAVQGFILFSFTSGLRQMCNLPVDSMKTGGLLHFTDLTAYDPTYILPAANAAILYLNVKRGVDVPQMTATNPQVARALMYGLPCVIFLASLNFSNGICFYWVATGVIAFIQSKVIKKYIVIDKQVSNPFLEKLKKEIQEKKDRQSKLGFIAGMKESWTNAKIAKEVKQRQQLDELSFERAGREPIRKTFKYNPKSTVLAQKQKPS